MFKFRGNPKKYVIDSDRERATRKLSREKYKISKTTQFLNIYVYWCVYQYTAILTKHDIPIEIISFELSGNSSILFS